MFKIIFYILNKILNNLDKILIVMQYCSLLVVFLFCVNNFFSFFFQQKHFYIHILTLGFKRGRSRNRVQQRGLLLEAKGSATGKQRRSLAGEQKNS